MSEDSYVAIWWTTGRKGNWTSCYDYYTNTPQRDQSKMQQQSLYQKHDMRYHEIGYISSYKWDRPAASWDGADFLWRSSGQKVFL